MRVVLLFAGFLSIAACRGNNGAASPQAHPTRETSSASMTPGECEARATFDSMDHRTPVPLLPMMADHQKENMRDHLLAVQQIVAALATSDFAAIETASGRIGFSEQMGMMCRHMGAGAPGFTEQGLAFHHTADTITEAAHRQDREGVIRALGATLQTCTNCHSVFRQRVVDEAGYRATGAAMPGMMMHHQGGNMQ